MKMKKKMFWVLGVTLLVLFIILEIYKNTDLKIEENGMQQELNRENVVLNYYTWSTEMDYIPELITAFEGSHKNYKINFHTFNAANEEYYKIIQVMLQSGADIDVYGVNSSSFYSQFYSQGFLEPLSSYMKKNNYDLRPYGTISSQINVDGEYYALPHRKTSWVLYYNKDIFDQAAKPYPVQLSWQGFVDLAYDLTYKRDDGVMQWGTSGYFISANNDSHFYAAQMGESLIDDELPHYKNGLEILNQIYHTKQSSLSFAETQKNGSDIARESFQNGEIAMMVGGDWSISTMLNAKAANKMKVNFNITYFPIPDGVKKGTTIGTATNTGICSYSRKKDAAFVFLAYLCGKEGASIISQKGILPAYQSTDITQTYIQVAPEINLGVIFKSMIKEEMPNEVASSALITATKEATSRYLSQSVNLDEAVDNWNAKRKEIVLYYKTK